MSIDISKVRVGAEIVGTEQEKFGIAKLATAMITAEVFFSTLWFSLSPRLSWEHSTAWVDEKHRVFFNPDFMLQMDKPEALYVMLHEMLHPSSFHIQRLFKMLGRRPNAHELQVWQMATDATINDYLSHEYVGLTIRMPTKPDGTKFGILLDDRRGRTTAEELYRELMEEIPPPPPSGGGSGDGEGEGDASGSGTPPPPSDGKGEEETDAQKQFKNMTADLILTGEGGDDEGEGESPGGTEPAQSQGAMDGMMRSIVAQAIDAARKAGKMPAGLERIVGDTLIPHKDYKSLLLDAMTPAFAGKDDYSWKRTNRNYRAQGIYAPSLALALGYRKIVFGVDTSGSQTDEDIALCIGSALQCAEQTFCNEMVIAYCDSKIHRIDRVEIGQTYDPADAPGGGGTSFYPFFELAEEEGADALVILTDLCASFPPEPTDYPVIWVTTIKGSKAPYGPTVDLRG